MPAPDLITSAEWINQTKRMGKSRSDALKLVDTYLDAYIQDKTPGNLENLRMFLKIWVDPKFKSHWYRSTVKLETTRDHKGAVTQLLNTIERTVGLRNPLPTDYPGIFIGDDVYRGNHWVPNDFVGTVITALRTLASRPQGKQLLDDISDQSRRSATKKVVIEYCGENGKSCAAPMEIMDNENRRLVQATQSLIDRDYPVPDAALNNPKLIATQQGTNESGTKRTYVGGEGTGAVVVWASNDPGPPWTGGHRPGFIALGHELVHAHHYMFGSCYRAATGFVSDNGNSGIMEEEMRTVGCMRYAGEIPSENALRGEHGIANRDSYDPRLCWDHVVVTPLIG